MDHQAGNKARHLEALRNLEEAVIAQYIQLKGAERQDEDRFRIPNGEPESLGSACINRPRILAFRRGLCKSFFRASAWRGRYLLLVLAAACSISSATLFGWESMAT